MDNFYYIAILRGHTIEIISKPFRTELSAFRALDSYDDSPDGDLIVIHIPADMEEPKLLS